MSWGKSTPAVVLCGGRATRMGSLADNLPKPLLPVNDRPMLWYILGRLYLSGFRRIVLPIGHLGHTIVDFARSGLLPDDCQIECIDTGVDTPVSRRIERIRHRLPPDGDFVLANGDGLFDFDMSDLVTMHRDKQAIATFATVSVTSKYGLLIVDGTRATGFERNSHVTGYEVEGPYGRKIGRIYSGICALKTAALDVMRLSDIERFEAELFPKLIASGRTECFEIRDFWLSVDTPKDLALANGDESTPEGSAVHILRRRLDQGLARMVAAK